MRARKAQPAAAVQPEDIEKAVAEVSKPEVNPYKREYGPLRTYEVTWADGRRETVQGHIVQFDTSSLFGASVPGRPRFAIRGEFGGHWRFVLGGFADDVKSVRDVTDRERGQAKLPAALQTPVTGNMQVGQAGYTVAWAMLADMKGQLWLKPEYDVKPQPHGTAQMRVERREDGYHVWPASGETYRLSHLWQKDLLPVTVLEEAEEDKA